MRELGTEERAAIIALAEKDYAANVADAAERVRIQAALADRALQSLIIANGGGLVALFSFASQAGRMRFDPAELKRSFASLAFGLGLALLAHMLAFISQDRFHLAGHHEARRNQLIIRTGEPQADQAAAKRAIFHGNIAYLIGLGVFVAAALAFVCGCWAALLATS